MIAGRYSRDREIGRGGMGAVWLGRDEVLGRAVAIKRVGLMPGTDDPDLDRAEREAKTAARLNHPNVVGVFDLVAENDQHWLVMEYVPGTTLSALIASKGALPLDQARAMIEQAATGLSVAHAAGITHRDVKPSNLLVRDDGHVKLSDFGIARGRTDTSLTQTGLVTGSPAYLAPEVASGQIATAASDVWALGATLFHALAGRTPYDVGDNVLGALYRIVNDDPPRLENAGWLGPLLVGTMAKEPADRWTMQQVRDFLRTEGTEPAPAPASAPPAAATATVGERTHVARGPGARVDRPRRRVGVLPIAVGALGLALVAMIVVLLYFTDDPQDIPASGGSESSSPTPSAPSTTESESPPAEPEAKAMESFIRSYLQTASRNPAQGFGQLTPDFQVASEGLDGYTGFWGSVRNPQVLSIEADPNALTVAYTYRYRFNGDEQEENINLQLEFDPATNSYLIAGTA